MRSACSTPGLTPVVSDEMGVDRVPPKRTQKEVWGLDIWNVGCETRSREFPYKKLTASGKRQTFEEVSYVNKAPQDNWCEDAMQASERWREREKNRTGEKERERDREKERMCVCVCVCVLFTNATVQYTCNYPIPETAIAFKWRKEVYHSCRWHQCRTRVRLSLSFSLVKTS